MPPARTPPHTASTVNVRIDDIERAQTVGGHVYHPHRVRTLGTGRAFRMDLWATRFADLTLGMLEYHSPVQVHSTPEPDFYQVNFTAYGSITMKRADSTITASSRQAAIHDWQHDPTLEGWRSPARIVGIKIPRETMERELAVLLGTSPGSRIRFSSGMNLDTPTGREWKLTALHLMRTLTQAPTLLLHPMVNRPLADSLVRGFLLSSQHSYSQVLNSTPPPLGPDYVRQAVEYMEAYAHLPLTVTEMADAVNVGVRTLQEAFRRHLDQTPVEVLREKRLHGARNDVLTLSGEITIADIALRWGFTHPGRFASHYARIFSESPSQTRANSTHHQPRKDNDGAEEDR